jgi:hypothetical protein
VPYVSKIKMYSAQIQGIGGQVCILGNIISECLGENLLFRVIKSLPIDVAGFLGIYFFKKIKFKLNLISIIRLTKKRKSRVSLDIPVVLYRFWVAEHDLIL